MGHDESHAGRVIKNVAGSLRARCRAGILLLGKNLGLEKYRDASSFPAIKKC